MSTSQFDHTTGIWVEAWNQRVGALAINPADASIAFQYTDSWRKTGIQLAPFETPLRAEPFVYQAVDYQTPGRFHGLPPFIADSLPDRFGDRVMDQYLSAWGIERTSLNALDRLAYIGARGVGALTYVPSHPLPNTTGNSLELAGLIRAARSVEVGDPLPADEVTTLLGSLLRVGGSAGGMHPKALVGFHPSDNTLMIGEPAYPRGYIPALLKLHFTDTHFASPMTIEKAYLSMAAAAGIQTPKAWLLSDETHHLLVRRFDRFNNARLHVSSAAALLGLNYQQPYTHDYAVLFNIANHLSLSMAAKRELFTRTVFNVVARVTDDHLKNTVFLCDQHGNWRLGPAFDLTFTADPDLPMRHLPGSHSTSVFGKFENIDTKTLLEFGTDNGLSPQDCMGIRAQVVAVVSEWPRFAEAAGCSKGDTEIVSEALTDWPG